MAPLLSLYSGPCSWCLRIAKWLPVIFIISIVVWSYFAYVIQLNILTIDSIVQKTLYLLVYHVILVLFLWSYWQTIFTEIGTVPKQFTLPPMELEAYEGAPTELDRRDTLERFTSKLGLPVVNRTIIGEIRYCEKCCHVKPDRCHHCSVCNQCVLKMDHHCPWVNNCVSFTNYKFFVLFLAYGFLYCVFVATTTLEFVITFWKADLRSPGKFHIIFVFFVAVMFAISLVSLLGYHIFLIIKNRSTIESFRAPIFHVDHRWTQDKEGFSLGSYNNFVEIFGDNRRTWFLPIFTSVGDGVNYQLRCGIGAAAGHASVEGGENNTQRSPSTVLTVAATPVSSSSHSSNPSYGSTSNSMGDGVSYPQRYVSEDMNGLLASDDETEWGSIGQRPYDNTQMVQQTYQTPDRNELLEVVVQQNHTESV